MPMNPRLLRPVSTTHPEAQVWRNAVIANGGSVSASTMRAVSKFCADVDSSGLRSKLVRVNLMCGDNLNAVLVPLFRATSRTGTQLGNTTDANDNFTNDHYAQNSGLVGNASNRRLLTGLARSAVSNSASLHAGVFAFTRGGGAFRQYIVCSAAAAAFNQTSLDTRANPANVAFANASSGSTGNTTDIAHAAKDFIVGCVSGAGANLLRMYINGSSVGTGTGVDSSANTAQFALFARRREDTGAWDLHSDARIGGYTIGLNLDDTESAAYSTVWDTFLKALGRR
jgi:hypothetical protein